MNVIYLVQKNDAWVPDQIVYKVGLTDSVSNLPWHEMIKVKYQIQCPYADVAVFSMMRELSKKFKIVFDFGYNYFQGNVKNIKMIMDNVKREFSVMNKIQLVFEKAENKLWFKTVKRLPMPKNDYIMLNFAESNWIF